MRFTTLMGGMGILLLTGAASATTAEVSTHVTQMTWDRSWTNPLPVSFYLTMNPPELVYSAGFTLEGPSFIIARPPDYPSWQFTDPVLPAPLPFRAEMVFPQPFMPTGHKIIHFDLLIPSNAPLGTFSITPEEVRYATAYQSGLSGSGVPLMLTITPEPGGLAMMGLGTLLLFRRRRARLRGRGKG